EHLPMKHGPEPSFRERMGKFAKRHPALCGTTTIAMISIVLIGLLGAGVVRIYGALREVHARLKVREFDRNFTETQSLLNSALGHDEHLKRGLKMATNALEELESATGSPPLSAGWPSYLTVRERRRLSEQLIELVMLQARARVMVAKSHGTEHDR